MRGRSMSREHFPADDDENTVVEVKGSEMWVEVWLWKLGGVTSMEVWLLCACKTVHKPGCGSGIEWCCVAISDTLLQTVITIRFPRSVLSYLA